MLLCTNARFFLSKWCEEQRNQHAVQSHFQTCYYKAKYSCFLIFLNGIWEHHYETILLLQLQLNDPINELLMHRLVRNIGAPVMCIWYSSLKILLQTGSLNFSWVVDRPGRFMSRSPMKWGNSQSWRIKSQHSYMRLKWVFIYENKPLRKGASFHTQPWIYTHLICFTFHMDSQL